MRIFQREWTTPSGETQRGRTYWAQYSVGGVRHYHSLGTRDKRAAELIAADHLRRAELRRAGVTDPFGAAKDLAIEEHLEIATCLGRLHDPEGEILLWNWQVKLVIGRDLKKHTVIAAAFVGLAGRMEEPRAEAETRGIASADKHLLPDRLQLFRILRIHLDVY